MKGHMAVITICLSIFMGLGCPATPRMLVKKERPGVAKKAIEMPEGLELVFTQEYDRLERWIEDERIKNPNSSDLLVTQGFLYLSVFIESKTLVPQKEWKIDPKARELFSGELETHPDNIFAKIGLAAVALQEGKLEDALIYTSQVMESLDWKKGDPSESLAWLVYRIAFLANLQKNTPELAREVVQQALERGLESSECRFGAALADLWGKDINQALKDLEHLEDTDYWSIGEKVCRENPAGGIALGIGITLKTAGYPEFLEMIATGFVRNGPCQGPASLVLAHLRLEQGNFQEAESGAREAIELLHGRIEPKLLLILVHIMMGRYDDARAELKDLKESEHVFFPLPIEVKETVERLLAQIEEKTTTRKIKVYDPEEASRMLGKRYLTPEEREIFIKVQARQGEVMMKILTMGGRVSHNPQLLERVNRILRKLVEALEYTDREFRITIVSSPMPGAWSNALGNIMITTSLMELLDQDGELASIIAHEIGHCVYSHAEEYAFRMFLDILSEKEGEQIVKRIKFRKDQEFEADEYGAFLSVRAGYKVRDTLSAFEKMIKKVGDDFSVEELSGDHPLWSQRIARLMKYRASMEEMPEYYNNGYSALTRGDYREARDAFQWVALYFPQDPGVRLNLGSSYLQEFQELAGLQEGDFQVSIQFEPKFRGAEQLRLMGVAAGEKETEKLKVEALANAVKEFSYTVIIDPESALAHNNLGAALIYQEGKRDQAETELKKAVQLRGGKLAIAENNMGVLKAQAGDFPDARAFFEKAIEDDPLLATAHFNLIVLAGSPAGKRLVKSSDLKTWCRDFLRMEPKGKRADIVKGVLREDEKKRGNE